MKKVLNNPPTITSKEIKSLATLLIRRARGDMSQTQINKKFGHTHNQCSRWERGQIKISWDDFLKLVKYSKVISFEDLSRRFFVLNRLQGHLEDLYQRICTQEKSSSPLAQKVYRLKSGRTQLSLNDMIEVFSLIGVLGAFLSFFFGLGTGENPEVVTKFLQQHLDDLYIANNYPLLYLVLNYFLTSEYLAEPIHNEEKLCKRLKLPAKDLRFYIELLLKMKSIELKDGKYTVIKRSIFIDTRELKQRWQAISKWFVLGQEFTNQYQNYEGETPRSQVGVIRALVSSQGWDRLNKAYANFLKEAHQIIKTDGPPYESIVLFSGMMFDHLEALQIAGIEDPELSATIHPLPTSSRSGS